MVFGIGGMAIIYVLAPSLDGLFRRVPSRVLMAAGLVLLLLFAADQFYSAGHPNTGKGITDYEAGILAAFLLGPSPAKRLLKQFSNTWLGVLLYALLVILMADLLRLGVKRLLSGGNSRWKERLFSRRGHGIIGLGCILCVGGLSLAGIVSADHISVTNYELSVDKEVPGLDELKIILAADLHLGYSIGIWHMEQMVDLIN